MPIRIDVSGEKVNGSINIAEMKTKRDDGQTIVSKNLVVDFDGMPMPTFLALVEGALRVKVQNSKLRVLPIAEARTWTMKTVKWDQIWARNVGRKEMSQEEIIALAKSDPEFKKRLMAELAR